MLGGGACGRDDEGGDASPSGGEIQVTSLAFGAGDAIPEKYTCEGDNVSPAVLWRLPGRAADVAIVLDDPDAPRGTFVHWVVTGVPADTASVGEGQLPDSAVEHANDGGSTGYIGPCPPNGENHTYRLRVFALDEPVPIAPGASPSAAVAAIEAAATAEGVLTATYGR